MDVKGSSSNFIFESLDMQNRFFKG